MLIVEDVLTLRTAGRRSRISAGHITAVILLVLFVCCLYTIGLEQAVPGTVSSGLENVEDTDIQMPGPRPKQPDVKPFRRILDHPEEIGIVILPGKEPAKDRMKDMAAADKLKPDKAGSQDRPVTVPGSSAAEEEVPDNGTGVSISVHVTFHGNGGTLSVTEMTLEEYYLDLSALENPRRLGKEFDGWYTDPSCTTAFTGIEEGQTRVDLYAGWKEITAYICDDRGYITGYSDAAAVADEGVLVLPNSPDCLGVEAGAFAGLENEIFDVFIPPNITYIAPGVLESFPYLMYIEVMAGNPAYYSDGGVLYKADGTLYVFPAGRDNWGAGDND